MKRSWTFLICKVFDCCENDTTAHYNTLSYISKAVREVYCIIGFCPNLFNAFLFKDSQMHLECKVQYALLSLRPPILLPQRCKGESKREYSNNFFFAQYAANR